VERVFWGRKDALFYLPRRKTEEIEEDKGVRGVECQVIRMLRRAELWLVGGWMVKRFKVVVVSLIRG
jgi:hypothetical protein